MQVPRSKTQACYEEESILVLEVCLSVLRDKGPLSLLLLLFISMYEYCIHHRQTLQGSSVQTDLPEFYRSLDSDEENSDYEEATENGHSVDEKPKEGTQHSSWGCWVHMHIARHPHTQPMYARRELTVVFERKRLLRLTLWGLERNQGEKLLQSYRSRERKSCCV